MSKQIEVFTKSQEGATLVEYGVALIMAIVLGAGGLTQLSQTVSDQMAEGSEIMVGEGSVRTGDSANS